MSYVRYMHYTAQSAFGWGVLALCQMSARSSLCAATTLGWVASGTPTTNGVQFAVSGKVSEAIALEALWQRGHKSLRAQKTAFPCDAMGKKVVSCFR